MEYISKQSSSRLYIKTTLVVLLLLGQLNVFGQNHIFLPVDSLFKKAEENSITLNASRQKINISHENTEIAKDKQLPSIEGNALLGYISNGAVWSKSFDYMETIKLPHIMNNYSVSAGVLVFGGRKLRNDVAKSKLEEQLAALDYKRDKEDIQFLLLSKYLDIFTLQNQRKVFLQNIDLAHQQYSNVEKLSKEGMVTRNDLIRSKLHITDLELQLTTVNNDILINSHDLSVVIGLPDSSIIDVDTTLYDKFYENNAYQNYVDSSNKTPELQAAMQKIKIAEKNIDLANAEKAPKVSLYAEDMLNRPYLNTLNPIPQDIYWHYFTGGVKLTYNISNLYTTKKEVNKAKSNYKLAETERDLLAQKTEMQIHKSYVKLFEAKDKFHTLQESYLLAKDNYRIVTQKYMNQLAIMTDVMDASTALLSSQLNMTNARISIIYEWYQLMKVSGNWEF